MRLEKCVECILRRGIERRDVVEKSRSARGRGEVVDPERTGVERDESPATTEAREMDRVREFARIDRGAFDQHVIVRRLRAVKEGARARLRHDGAPFEAQSRAPERDDRTLTKRYAIDPRPYGIDERSVATPEVDQDNVAVS